MVGLPEAERAKADRPRRAGIALALLGAAVSLAGCGSSDQMTDRSGTLIVAVQKDIRGFDVQNYSLSSLEAVHVNVFDHLVKWDAALNLVPDLAQSWERVSDHAWRFHLRRGVTWHDGSAFDAADVKFTLERAARDPLVTDTAYRIIDRVVIVDPHTVDVITKRPDPMLLNRLARVGSYIMPAAYIRKGGFQNYLRRPIGTGPYKVASWSRDDRVVLSANDRYFGGRPRWRTVVVRAVPDESTRVSELVAGGVDVAVGMPVSDIGRVAAIPRLKTVSGPSQRAMQMMVKTAPAGVTGDVRVRRAIDLAVDDALICRTIFSGHCRTTLQVVTPGAPGFDPSLDGRSNYDPRLARALLKEARYDPRRTLRMVGTSGVFSQDREVALAVAAMLRQAGLTVDLDLVDGVRFNKMIRQRRLPDLYIVGYTNSMFDGEPSLMRFADLKGKGVSDFRDKAYAAIVRSAGEQLDPAERAAQLRSAQRILAAQLPVIPMFRLADIYGLRSDLDLVPRHDELVVANDIGPAGKAAVPSRPPLNGRSER